MKFEHTNTTDALQPELLMPEAGPVEAAPAAEEHAPERQYCLFRAGRERFCLSVLDVEEVVEWSPVTRLPLGPAFLLGIFNLRGSIVPVIDIAFTEGRRPDLTPKHVVVTRLQGDAERGDLRLGLAADEVIGTYTTAEPLLVEQAPLGVPHCCGMLRQDDRLALALDLDRLTAAFPVPVI
ncbi:MAG: chemotaxis protein CheW [Terriglobales bacterium]